MEITIVILVVAAAAVYVGWTFYKGFKQKNGCACTCCSAADTCSEAAAKPPHDPTPDRPDR